MMIDRLGPYPTMQDSGVPWLGEVPEHWMVRRIKTLFREKGERSNDGTGLLLSLTRARGLLPQSEASNRLAGADDLSKHKVCRPSDLVMNRMQAWSGMFAVSPLEGLVSPDYSVFEAIEPCEVKHFEHLFKTPGAVDQFVQASKGIGSGFNRLYTPDFGAVPIVVPPLSEQIAIVRFLDDADRRIRRYISAKQKLIALLAEKREAATHDALRLAGSRSLRIGSAADRVERLISRRDEQVYTPIGLYNRGRGIFHKPATRGSDLGDSTFFWLAEGDLVLSGQFAWEGAVALAGEEDDGCVASHRYPVLRGKLDLVESAYLLSFFRTGWGQLLLDHHSRGAAGRNRPLNAASLMKERVPVPSLHVQKQIGTLVRREYRLRQALAEQATLLREYRTRLITDVVTGKLDVREAAAGLRDEIKEPEPFDETSALIDGEEEPSDDLDAVPEEAEV